MKKKSNLIPIEFYFKPNDQRKFNSFFQLKKNVTGESFKSKLRRVRKYLNKYEINYLYVSASENANWLLNIRGRDLPNSPLANCKLIVTDKSKIYFFSNLNKIKNLKKEKLNDVEFFDEKNFLKY